MEQLLEVSKHSCDCIVLRGLLIFVGYLYLLVTLSVIGYVIFTLLVKVRVESQLRTGVVFGIIGIRVHVFLLSNLCV